MRMSLAAVSASPKVSDLPGSNVLQQLVNGADAWALAITLLGAFVGAAVWAIASHSNNHHYAARGRMAALVSAAAALLIGAAPGLVNFFQALGAKAK
jgi:Mn2+/Fe2+ NRAMP family transporter